MRPYVALLRGINVGGKNLIKMRALKACFEAHGFQDVATYIQSGNVIFAAEEGTLTELTERIEAMLVSEFGYRASVVLRGRAQMRQIVDRAPDGFGADPQRYRYDVIFLKSPLTASTAMKSVRTKDGVDRAWTGTGVLYFERLVARASQSHLSRIVSMPVYQRMTIRNWNTATNLLQLMDRTDGG
jgi:uncharacterized protein (DUF1697 family)